MLVFGLPFVDIWITDIRGGSNKKKYNWSKTGGEENACELKTIGVKMNEKLYYKLSSDSINLKPIWLS